jgi:hypothetical protein
MKECGERVVVVALPRLQYRVSNPQNQPTNTILQTRTAEKWLSPLFGFGLTHAPIRPEGFDRKNTVIGKYRGKAATVHNEHIGSMAALPPLEKTVRKESLSPAGKYLEAATAPICQNVIRHVGSAVLFGSEKDRALLTMMAKFDKMNKKNNND